MFAVEKKHSFYTCMMIYDDVGFFLKLFLGASPAINELLEVDPKPLGCRG